MIPERLRAGGELRLRDDRHHQGRPGRPDRADPRRARGRRRRRRGRLRGARPRRRRRARGPGHRAQLADGRSPAPAGKLGIPGLYVTGDPGGVDEAAQEGSLSIRIGLGWAKSHSFATGQCPVMKYHRGLMQMILSDKAQIAKAVNATVDHARRGAAGLPGLRQGRGEEVRARPARPDRRRRVAITAGSRCGHGRGGCSAHVRPPPPRRPPDRLRRRHLGRRRRGAVDPARAARRRDRLRRSPSRRCSSASGARSWRSAASPGGSSTATRTAGC